MKLGLVAILGVAVIGLGACTNNTSRPTAENPPPAANDDRRNSDTLPPPPVRSEELQDNERPARRLDGAREADLPPPPDRGAPPPRRASRDVPPPPRGNTRIAAADSGNRLTVAGTVATVGGRCKNVIRGANGQRYVIDRSAAAGLKVGQRVRFTATRGEEQVCPGMIRVVPAGRIAPA